MSDLKPIRHADLLERDLGDEIVIYDAEAQFVHLLNTAAGLLWKLCDGEHSLDDMAQALRDTFELDERADVGRDIIDILEQMRQKGLVV